MSFLDKKSKEATTSRYEQILIPSEEGSETRIAQSSTSDLPDLTVTQQLDNAGGSITEKSLEDYSALGRYGKVRVLTETHAGHVVMLDETEDNERILILHPNGTYTHFTPEGRICKTEGSDVELVHGDKKIEISGNLLKFTHGEETITIDGSKSETVTKSMTENFKAGWTVNITGNTEISASGDVDISADGDANVTATNVNVTASAVAKIKASLISLN
jgi:hypothetical protein